MTQEQNHNYPATTTAPPWFLDVHAFTTEADLHAFTIDPCLHADSREREEGERDQDKESGEREAKITKRGMEFELRKERLGREREREREIERERGEVMKYNKNDFTTCYSIF